MRQGNLKGYKLIIFLLLFTVEGEGGGSQCFFFPLDIWKGGRRRGERGTFRVSRNVFFIVERLGRGSLGVIFLQIHYGTGERVHRGFRVQVDFFSSFFYYWGGGGWRLMFFFCLHLTCGRRKGKGWFFFNLFIFHCGVVRDKGSRVFFLICWRGMGGSFFFLVSILKRDERGFSFLQVQRGGLGLV